MLEDLMTSLSEALKSSTLNCWVVGTDFTNLENVKKAEKYECTWIPE